MEFKPTVGKSVFSLLVALVMGIYGGEGKYVGSNIIRYDFLTMLIVFVVIFIILYSVWSLFQKQSNLDTLSVYTLLIGLILCLIIIGLVPYFLNQPN